VIGTASVRSSLQATNAIHFWWRRVLGDPCQVLCEGDSRQTGYSSALIYLMRRPRHAEFRSLPWTRSSSRRNVLLVAKKRRLHLSETLFSPVLVKRPLESILAFDETTVPFSMKRRRLRQLFDFSPCSAAHRVFSSSSRFLTGVGRPFLSHLSYNSRAILLECKATGYRGPGRRVKSATMIRICLQDSLKHRACSAVADLWRDVSPGSQTQPW